MYEDDAQRSKNVLQMAKAATAWTNDSEVNNNKRYEDI